VQYAKLANPDGFYTLVKASRIDAELNPILRQFRRANDPAIW
jgi:hypothetical protein